MRNVERNLERKNIKGKIIANVKLFLFITMLVMTYFISEKAVDFILALDVEVLKRALNIILVSIVVIIYKK